MALEARHQFGACFHKQHLQPGAGKERGKKPAPDPARAELEGYRSHPLTVAHRAEVEQHDEQVGIIHCAIPVQILAQVGATLPEGEQHPQ